VDKRDLTSGSAARLSPEVFGVADGMKSNECSGISQPAATRLPDGRLVFPTTRGIVVVDPERLPRNRTPPQVQVEELLASGASYGGERRELPPGAANWEIHFAGLSFVAPQKVHFRYRLVGFDDEWVEAGPRRTAFYTQVPPGEYRFEVLAANEDGVWSTEAAAVAITLRPRFHQTRLFLVLVVLSILALGALGFALHVRGLHARRRELERLVRERTRALTEQQLRAEEARAEAERLREKAERQKEIAQEATAVKAEMLQIAAHDLKNPLQVVLGHAEIAEASLKEGRPVDEFLGQIHQAADRMLAILRRLLDGSAMDAGRLVLRGERVDLAQVARQVVSTSLASAVRKRQDLSLVAEGPLPVTGDEERLTEILENLVGNAIKYSPYSTAIVVDARGEGGRARVEVKDAGPGLTEDDKQRMFGRFQRLSARPTGGEPATGLGLSISKQLAELMGGTLTADSEGPGKGARFTLSMPLASPPVPSTDPRGQP
jgi:signal transduction histidine kinase